MDITKPYLKTYARIEVEILKTLLNLYLAHERCG